MPSIADLREEYTKFGLTEAEAGDDPHTLFDAWMQTAIDTDLHDPNAMILATATPEGKPSARAVLLKGHDTGFLFYTNYNSRKAEEIAANPHAALCFLWHPLERQIRIEGTLEKVSAAESDDYFARRPYGSQLGAWASPQSEVVTGRAELEQRHETLKEKYPEGSIPRPQHWGGYRLKPETFEFWQGRRNRMHDRIVFRRVDGRWRCERLAP